MRNHLKVSSEVVAARQLLPARQRLVGSHAGAMSVQRHLVKKWGLSRVSGCGAGVAAGALGTISLVWGAVYDLYGKTDHYARTNGLFGCLYGFAASLVSICLLPVPRHGQKWPSWQRHSWPHAHRAHRAAASEGSRPPKVSTHFCV